MRAKTLCQKLLSETSLHHTRLEALSEIVETVLIGKTLSVTGIGRKMENSNQTRSNIRKADRLYSNPHLYGECEMIYQTVAKQLVKSERPFILVDGSKLQNSPWSILRASLVNKGRAITLYECLYEMSEQGSPKLYGRFLKGLKVVLGDCKPIVITDAEFRTPWFKQLQEMKWDFIGRIRGMAKIALGDEDFQSCQDIFAMASNKPRALGEGSLSTHHDCDGYFYLHRRPPKNRHAHTRSGKQSETLKSLRHAKSAHEPWLLFSSLENCASYLIQAYTFRMTIEENFRDTKSGRYGLGLKMTFSRQKSRYAIMLLVAMLASTIAYLIGAVAEKIGIHRQFQANSTRHRRVLSRFFLGCEVLKKRFIFHFRQLKSIMISLQKETFSCFVL